MWLMRRNTAEHIQIMSWSLSAKEEQYQYQLLYLQQLHSLHPLCHGYCEAWIGATSAHWHSLRMSVAVVRRGEETSQWTWTAARARVGLSPAKVTRRLCKLTLAGSRSQLWGNYPSTAESCWSKSGVGSSGGVFCPIHTNTHTQIHTHTQSTVLACSTGVLKTTWAHNRLLFFC